MNEFLVLCFVFSFTFKEKKKKAELRSEVQSSASSPCPLKSRRTPGQSKQLYDLLRFIAKPPEKAVTPGPALIRRHGLAERGVRHLGRPRVRAKVPATGAGWPPRWLRAPEPAVLPTRRRLHLHTDGLDVPLGQHGAWQRNCVWF